MKGDETAFTGPPATEGRRVGGQKGRRVGERLGFRVVLETGKGYFHFNMGSYWRQRAPSFWFVRRVRRSDSAVRWRVGGNG